MGLFSRSKKYYLDRQCLCGALYKILYQTIPGKPPKITYPDSRYCPGCGRLRSDPGRRRRRFDSNYERGYGSQFL